MTLTSGVVNPAENVAAADAGVDAGTVGPAAAVAVAGDAQQKPFTCKWTAEVMKINYYTCECRFPLNALTVIFLHHDRSAAVALEFLGRKICYVFEFGFLCI